MNLFMYSFRYSGILFFFVDENLLVECHPWCIYKLPILLLIKLDIRT
jgi:hypothetical protein